MRELLQHYLEYRNNSLFKRGTNRIVCTRSSKGFVTNFCNVQFDSAKLIWIYHYGDIPEDHYIGFIDGDPFNCCIENLCLRSEKNYKQLPNCIFAYKNDSIDLEGFVFRFVHNGLRYESNKVYPSVSEALDKLKSFRMKLPQINPSALNKTPINLLCQVA